MRNAIFFEISKNLCLLQGLFYIITSNVEMLDKYFLQLYWKLFAEFSLRFYCIFICMNQFLHLFSSIKPVQFNYNHT